MDRIEELLNSPYWIIDMLPARVPEDSPGQYFAVESHLLRTRLASIRQRHLNVILKLNCYLDLSIGGEINPAPERISAALSGGSASILLGDAMILSEPDDTHMTLFNPDERLLQLVRKLAESEGLFVWSGSSADERRIRVKLKRLPFEFSVCQLAGTAIPALPSDFCFIGRTDEELSLVCRTEDVPAHTLARDDGWRCFRVEGPLDFSLIGILSGISTLLAENRIGLFAVSTFNTDYILVKAEQFERALAVLAQAGYEVA